MGYSVKEIAQNSQVNMSLSTVKRLKFKIKAHGSIMREVGSGRPEKLSKIHKNYILKLIANSSFNISNRIAINLNNNYEVEVHRSTFSRFLVEKGINGKDRRLFIETMNRTKRIGLNFVSKIRKEIGAMCLLQMMHLSIIYRQENIDRLHQVIHTKGQKQSTPKKFMFGEHSTLKVS